MVCICWAVHWSRTFLLLSKVMQSDDIDIFTILTSMLKCVKEVDKLSSTHLDRRPICRTFFKCTSKSGAISYQSQELVQLEATLSAQVSDCIKSKPAWFDLKFLRDLSLPLKVGRNR